MTAHARVTRGAALLDRTFGPGWWHRVNTDELEMENACSCVLGQLFQGQVPTSEQQEAFGGQVGHSPLRQEDFEGMGYWSGRAIIDGPILSEQGAIEHGFHSRNVSGDYQALHDAWLLVIAERTALVTA